MVAATERFLAKLMIPLAGIAALAPAAGLPLTCTPAKPVAIAGETIQVRAWVPKGDRTLTWSAEEGDVSATGEIAIWDLTGVSPGPKTITVRVSGIGACAARVWVESRVETRGDRLTRRFLVPRGAPEPADYGLYSYIVLTPDKGGAAAKQRNRVTVEAWLSRLLAASAEERREKRAELNATFLPVDSEPGADPTTDWLLQHYDYNRADEILAAVQGKRTGGPYLVSAERPLKKDKPARYLWLDASWAPASTIPLWFDAFVNQASQERFDTPIAFERFNLNLRTILSVFAEEVPHAIGSIVAVVK